MPYLYHHPPTSLGAFGEEAYMSDIWALKNPREFPQIWEIP